MSPKAEPSRTDAIAPDLPGLLVDPSWLMERLGSPGLCAVDLRDEEAHADGHIPGAVHLDLSELGATVGGRENVLLPPEEFSDLMSERGISNGTVVVAYDDQWGLAAARLVWALHRYGHERVALLNGGWDRWRDEGGPVAQGKERVASGAFEAVPREGVHADMKWVAQRIETGQAVLIDTRTPAEFAKGHLPGAMVWDWFNAVPAGSWEASRDPEELLAEWRALGLDVSDEVTVYCRSGMRASHTFVMLRHAGFPRVRLYDGSWQEWSMRSEGTDDL